MRSTSAHSYDASLAASRKAVMEDLHRIPVANIDDMLTAMFSGVDSAFSDVVVNTLKSNGAINSKGRWRAFDVQPSEQTQDDDTVYNNGLCNIFDSIIPTAKSLGRVPHVPMTLKVAGTKTPRSERSNKSKPDGYFHLLSSKVPSQDYMNLELGPDHTHWADIVCPMEFKKADDEINRYDVCCRVRAHADS
jgi:hypothetical protein